MKWIKNIKYSKPLSCPKYLVRLSAPVVLQIHPLKGIFLLSHQQFTAQYQFSRTRRPLYLVLHFNHQPRAPHVTDCPFTYSHPTLSYPSTFLTSLSPTYPRRPCPPALPPTAALRRSSPRVAGRDSGEARRLAGPRLGSSGGAEVVGRGGQRQ
jgi:hypothetical protein